MSEQHVWTRSELNFLVHTCRHDRNLIMQVSIDKCCETLSKGLNKNYNDVMWLLEKYRPILQDPQLHYDGLVEKLRANEEIQVVEDKRKLATPSAAHFLTTPASSSKNKSIYHIYTPLALAEGLNRTTPGQNRAATTPFRQSLQLHTPFRSFPITTPVRPAMMDSPSKSMARNEYQGKRKRKDTSQTSRFWKTSPKFRRWAVAEWFSSELDLAALENAKSDIIPLIANYISSDAVMQIIQRGCPETSSAQTSHIHALIPDLISGKSTLVLNRLAWKALRYSVCELEGGAYPRRFSRAYLSEQIQRRAEQRQRARLQLSQLYKNITMISSTLAPFSSQDLAGDPIKPSQADMERAESDIKREEQASKLNELWNASPISRALFTKEESVLVLDPSLFMTSDHVCFAQKAKVLSASLDKSGKIIYSVEVLRDETQHPKLDVCDEFVKRLGLQKSLTPDSALTIGSEDAAPSPPAPGLGSPLHSNNPFLPEGTPSKELDWRDQSPLPWMSSSLDDEIFLTATPKPFLIESPQYMTASPPSIVHRSEVDLRILATCMRLLDTKRDVIGRIRAVNEAAQSMDRHLRKDQFRQELMESIGLLQQIELQLGLAITRMRDTGPMSPPTVGMDLGSMGVIGYGNDAGSSHAAAVIKKNQVRRTLNLDHEVEDDPSRTNSVASRDQIRKAATSAEQYARALVRSVLDDISMNAIAKEQQRDPGSLAEVWRPDSKVLDLAVKCCTLLICASSKVARGESLVDPSTAPNGISLATLAKLALDIPMPNGDSGRKAWQDLQRSVRDLCAEMSKLNPSSKSGPDIDHDAVVIGSRGAPSSKRRKKDAMVEVTAPSSALEDHHTSETKVKPERKSGKKAKRAKPDAVEQASDKAGGGMNQASTSKRATTGKRKEVTPSPDAKAGDEGSLAQGESDNKPKKGKGSGRGGARPGSGRLRRDDPRFIHRLLAQAAGETVVMKPGVKKMKLEDLISLSSNKASGTGGAGGASVASGASGAGGSGSPSPFGSGDRDDQYET